MLEKNVSISILLDCYGTLLTERQFRIVDMYRNDDLSLGEIAELTGITRQGVSECIRKAEDALLSYEEKLGVYEKGREREKTVEEIRNVLSGLTGKCPEISGVLAKLDGLLG